MRIESRLDPVVYSSHIARHVTSSPPHLQSPARVVAAPRLSAVVAGSDSRALSAHPFRQHTSISLAPPCLVPVCVLSLVLTITRCCFESEVCRN